MNVLEIQSGNFANDIVCKIREAFYEEITSIQKKNLYVNIVLYRQK